MHDHLEGSYKVHLAALTVHQMSLNNLCWPFIASTSQKSRVFAPGWGENEIKLMILHATN